MMELFYILIAVVVTQTYTHVKTLRTMYQKNKFTVYRLKKIEDHAWQSQNEKQRCIFSYKWKGNLLPPSKSDLYRLRRKEIKKAFGAPGGEFAEDITGGGGKE